MVAEAKIVAGILQVMYCKNFMNWDVVCGNPIRDINMQIQGLAYWKLTRVDLKTRREIGTRRTEKRRHYIALFYYTWQAVGVWIMAEGLFKIDLWNGGLKVRVHVRIIGNLDNDNRPNTQTSLDNQI